MDDGNILLVIDTTGFRVHRSILSLHSEVFQDMFSIPGMEGHSELIDGLPVVRLLDDDPFELIRAGYDVINRFVRPRLRESTRES